MRTICLLIRVKFLKHIQKAPRALRICVSQEQVDARDALFKLYLNSAQQSELYPALHKLLVTILCHHTMLDKLACPTDYSVCLACLEEESNSAAWEFKAPSSITGHFSRLQYCLRMIFFTHCFSIAQDGPKYQTPSLPPPSISPPKLLTSNPNPSSIDPILLEVEAQRDNEDTSEIVNSTGSQPYGYDEGDLGSIDSIEDDIEIVDNEQDKNLLQ